MESPKQQNSPASSGSNWQNYAINEILVLGAFGVFFGAILFLLLACVYAIMRRRVYFLELNPTSSWIPRREGIPRSRTRRIRGLDAKIMESLPTFVFTSQSEDSHECAICLSEFEEGEKLRVLPNCKHNFHVECIDMWFGSHWNCPVCRIVVEGQAQVAMGDNIGAAHSSNGNDRAVVVLNIAVIEQGQSSGGGVEEGSNSGASPKESGEISSPNASQSGRFSRLDSLKRILSRGREGKVFPTDLHQNPSESEGNSC